MDAQTRSASGDEYREPAISEVTEQKLALNKELANALPGATREHVDQVQAEVRARVRSAPDGEAAAEEDTAAVEDLRAAPEEALERVRRGKGALPGTDPAVPETGAR